MKKIMVSLIVVMVFALSNCATMKALDKDIKHTGSKIGSKIGKGLTKAGDAINKSVGE